MLRNMEFMLRSMKYHEDHAGNRPSRLQLLLRCAMLHVFVDE